MIGEANSFPGAPMEAVQSLGKYEIRGTLGRGAMGVVYDGWDPVIARRVAIKTVPLPENPDPETAEEIARFKREAQAAGRLTHPNIVGIYDYGETSNLAYIVMEFVDGPSLKNLLDKQERFPTETIGRVMADVLGGLQFSHERGVVHRDIKPANVMLTSDGRAKIADFGIARIEASSMTQAGTMLGTPAYMSPEQFMGQVVDARTDVYSAGVMLYQLLTGERPFDGGLTAIMHKVLNTEPPPPSELAVTSPASLDAVVKRAMAKRPDDRFPSAAAFAEALRAALAEAPAKPAEAPDAESTMLARPGAKPAAAPPPRPAAEPAPARSRLQLFLGVAVAAVVIAAGGAFVLLRPAPTPTPPPAKLAEATPAPTPAPAPAPAVQPTAEAPAKPAAEATPPPAPPSAPTPAPRAQVQPAPAEVQPAPAAPAAEVQPTPTAPAAEVQPAPPPTQPEAKPAPAASQQTAPPAEAKPPVTAAPPPVQTAQPVVPPTPTPTPTPAPSAAPPAAKPAAQQPAPEQPAPEQPAPQQQAPQQQAAAGGGLAGLRQQLAQALKGARCALADATVQDSGRVSVTGLAGSSAAPALKSDLATLAGGHPLDWRVRTVDPVFCPAFAALQPATPGEGLVLSLASGRTALHDGERILPRITMADFNGELRVDYLGHDRSIVHLYPTVADAAQHYVAVPARRLSPGTLVTLGDNGPGQPEWEVGPPYGTDMIIAVASSTPLFPKNPPQNAADDAAPYLDQLTRAIAAARAAGGHVSTAVLLVDTLPKQK